MSASRPHRYPQRMLDAEADGAEIIAWKCAECGALMREYGPKGNYDTECVDWSKVK